MKIKSAMLFQIDVRWKGHMKCKHFFSFQKKYNKRLFDTKKTNVLVKLSAIWFYRVFLFASFRFPTSLLRLTIYYMTLVTQIRTFIYFVKHCVRFCKAELFFFDIILPEIFCFSLHTTFWIQYFANNIPIRFDSERMFLGVSSK